MIRRHQVNRYADSGDSGHREHDPGGEQHRAAAAAPGSRTASRTWRRPGREARLRVGSRLAGRPTAPVDAPGKERLTGVPFG
ncbi:hypothetical protein GCM10009760_12570 [Kitasatospora kazusensis]|uniref:Uncharacterized protein n=1 Tax=Kitasatospora kazusensis TaxID=407974 RepID=A0ABN2Z0C2_9ACTN